MQFEAPLSAISCQLGLTPKGVELVPTAAPQPRSKRALNHLRPVPPSSASVDGSGELKDTPANRALHPSVAPQTAFNDRKITDGAFYADDRSILLCGAVKDQLQKLVDAGLKVDCIVTSPPYYGQRDYGVEGQIGHEDHPSKFIDELVEVFRLCRKVRSEEHTSEPVTNAHLVCRLLL